MHFKVTVPDTDALDRALAEFGPLAYRGAQFAIVTATRDTGTEAGKTLAALTRIKKTRLKRRLYVRTTKGTIWVGLKPVLAAWVEPLTPRDQNPRRQRKLPGSKAGGGRFDFPGYFVARRPDSKDPQGHRLAIWKRKGKDRFPVSEARIPLEEFGIDDLGMRLQRFALDRLERELDRHLLRLWE